MRVVVVGEANAGSRTPQRVKAMRELGHDVVHVATTPPGWSYESRAGMVERLRYRLRLPADSAGANAALLEAVGDGCDVLVLDNARAIRAVTLEAARRRGARRLVWYSEDDMMNPVHRSRWTEAAMGRFDLWVTTKSYNARPDEVPSLGVRRVLFVHNSYDRDLHAPFALAPGEAEAWGADVAFVGTWERPRADELLALAEAGLAVRVWGNGWSGLAGRHPLLRVEGRPAYGDDYRRVVAASRINLCFLRKGNRDLQTCRSMEIPAMGGFMLHERSAELATVFAADRETVYFSGAGELIATCRRWLADDPGRQRIAAAGRAKAEQGGHSHHARWDAILRTALEAA
jgi:hypothetical protein